VDGDEIGRSKYVDYVEGLWRYSWARATEWRIEILKLAL